VGQVVQRVKVVVVEVGCRCFWVVRFVAVPVALSLHVFSLVPVASWSVLIFPFVAFVLT
jgi:hypothetical protein